MYSVTVRDHIMIAHSLPDDFFGPAAGLHGATYVVDVTFSTGQLNSKNVVIDIGKAHEILKTILGDINYKNLDEHAGMTGKLTTTEFIARYIHDRIKEAASEVFDGKIKVTLGESHVAWASYEA